MELMAVKSVKIDADNDDLEVKPNVAKLSPGDTVEWEIVNLGAGLRLDIEFHDQSVCGPFVYDGANTDNPARGWYACAAAKKVKSNNPDQSGATMWKYDVVLYD